MSDAKNVAKRPQPLRLPRAEIVIAATAVLLVAFMAWLAVQVVGLHHDLDTSNHARDQLARQVQGLGASPVAGPPGSRGEPGPAVTGPRGEQGIPGRDSTIPGPTGSPGAPGKNSTVAGPPGAPGRDSTVPGPTGRAGAPGADSTVPGPKGDQGSAGKDGRDGSNGAPPAGWTYTDAAGITYTCSPAAGFDPAAPRYTCTANQPTPAPPPPSPARRGLLGVGLLAASSSYRKLL
ncbi:collagen-like protein [Streptomyces sp. H10-C2]|uniref:collagen-like protein n=1 Tax=unclassified Streptomyces TaxID=2593676 RepID=UPI0024B90C46|nr:MULTISPECIES: collagen-like protein [unclassified Streptomyces]MDJ0345236.1 collagen-like protein [Streptomyces sp. PH10-H1]MDJ0368818.1 collagen-like protein [Streptomyces sp. H10-C2]